MFLSRRIRQAINIDLDHIFNQRTNVQAKNKRGRLSDRDPLPLVGPDVGLGQLTNSEGHISTGNSVALWRVAKQTQ